MNRQPENKETYQLSLMHVGLCQDIYRYGEECQHKMELAYEDYMEIVNDAKEGYEELVSKLLMPITDAYKIPHLELVNQTKWYIDYTYLKNDEAFLCKRNLSPEEELFMAKPEGNA